MMKTLMCSALVLTANLALAYDGWQPIGNCYQLQTSDDKDFGSSFDKGDHWPNGILPTAVR